MARYILRGGDSNEIAELQEALGIIWAQIKRISHQGTITILKKSKEMIELKQNGESKSILK